MTLVSIDHMYMYFNSGAFRLTGFLFIYLIYEPCIVVQLTANVCVMTISMNILCYSYLMCWQILLVRLQLMLNNFIDLYSRIISLMCFMTNCQLVHPASNCQLVHPTSNCQLVHPTSNCQLVHPTSNLTLINCQLVHPTSNLTLIPHWWLVES